MEQRRFGSAAILCGGRSSRMGFDKCSLIVGQRPLYEHIAIQLSSLFDEILLIVDKGKSIDSKGFRLVEDKVSGQGPVGGILTGLYESASEYVFFTACDMPFVDLNVIRLFQDRLNEGNYQGAAGLNNGFVEPLYSFYGKSFISEIENATAIQGKGISIGKLAKKGQLYLSPEQEWRLSMQRKTIYPAAAQENSEETADNNRVDVYSNVNYQKDLYILQRIYGKEVTVHGKCKKIQADQTCG